MRIVSSRPATLTHRMSAEPGGPVAVDVVAHDGAAVASGTSPVPVGEEVSFDLPASAVPGPELLTVSWDAGDGWVETDVVEVAGGWVADPARVAADDRTASMPDALVEAAAAVAEDRIEEFLGVAHVNRLAVVRPAADGTRQLSTGVQRIRQVETVWVDGDLQDDPGRWQTSSSGVVLAPRAIRPTQDVEMAVVHGYDSPPADLADAAVRAAAQLAAEAVDRHRVKRAEFADGASWLIATASPAHGRPFGIPDIDAVVVQHREQALVAS